MDNKKIMSALDDQRVMKFLATIFLGGISGYDCMACLYHNHSDENARKMRAKAVQALFDVGMSHEDVQQLLINESSASYPLVPEDRLRAGDFRVNPCVQGQGLVEAVIDFLGRTPANS